MTSDTPDPVDPARRVVRGEDIQAIIDGSPDDVDAVPVPYADLDALVGGFRPGQLIAIASRPAAGKSIMALDIARHAAIRHRLPVLLASPEMDEIAITERVLSAEGRIASDALRHRRITADERARLAELRQRLEGTPLIIDDRPRMSVESLRAEVQRMKHRADVGAARLLVVDCLNTLEPDRPATARTAETRAAEVAEVTRDLKRLAGELEIPIVVTVRLIGPPEDRARRRPSVAELWESDEILYVGDVVILLHRPDLEDRETPRAGEADLIVTKQRNGVPGVVTVAFQGHYSRFVDMAFD